MDLGLFQKEVAERIGAHTSTICNWELEHAEPALWQWPAIIKVLGFVPFEVGESLRERLKSYRAIHGLSQRKLARILEVDPSTVRGWESGRRLPSQRHRERIRRLVESLPDSDE